MNPHIWRHFPRQAVPDLVLHGQQKNEPPGGLFASLPVFSSFVLH